jgi:Mitochondrial glycoprotein
MEMRADDGADVNDELVLKLQQEYQVEQDLNSSPNSRSDAMKKALDAFLEESGYEIQDTPGNSEVALVRKFEAET